jgi:hypothetical protein
LFNSATSSLPATASSFNFSVKRVSYRATDAPEKSGGEPSISWYRWQIAELSHAAKLTLVEIRTQLVIDAALWHRAYLRRDE